MDPLTAADPDEDAFALDIEEEQTPTGYEVDVSEGVADLTPVYDAAIQRLRAQRGGMSARQRLGALLVGFGQPTRHGKWQEGVSNAALTMFQLSQQQRERDERRREQLERLQTQREVAGIRSKAQIEAARIRAAKGTAPPKPRVQVSQNPLTGEAEAFDIRMDANGAPVVKRIGIGGAPESVAIPEITEPDQAAQHPDAPVVNTPKGLMKNPFYKGGG